MWSAITALCLLAAGGAPEPTRADHPSAQILAQALERVAELEYDQAASLLTEVIVDDTAPEAVMVQARTTLAEVEVIRGYNAEARAHYRWLLQRDPAFDLPASGAPKARGFFKLVREDFLAERAKEQELLAATERGKAAVRRAADEEAERARREVGSAHESSPSEVVDSAPPAGVAPEGAALPEPDLLGGSLAAYGIAAGTVGVFAPFALFFLASSPENLPVLGTACFGCLACGAPVAQGLAIVGLGDVIGGSTSRWAYLSTVLASAISFVLGGALAIVVTVALSVVASLFLGGIVLGAGNSVTYDTNRIFGGTFMVTVAVGALFLALQPIVPIATYALHGGDRDRADALDDGASRSRNDGNEHDDDDDDDDDPMDY